MYASATDAGVRCLAATAYSHCVCRKGCRFWTAARPNLNRAGLSLFAPAAPRDKME